MRKILIKTFFTLIILAGLGLAGFLALRSYVISKAEENAKHLISETLPSSLILSPDEEVIAFTKAIFERFQEKEPSELWALRLRPFVTNQRLPEWLRIPEGAIETIVQAGMCDNAARQLKFVLAQKNYSANQWNMVTDNAAHSALLVSLPNGHQGFVDPFYGFAAVREGKLISAETAQNLIRNGESTEQILQAFGSKSRPAFYADFSSMRMAGAGQILLISATLPKLDGHKKIILGNIDKNDMDVKSAASGYNMSPYWHYMGHKYNREWVRELVATQDIRLEMTLVSDVEKGILISEPKPKISGKILSWNLKKGDKIIFRDGLAQVSWRRLNSYIGIDQIAIYPLDL